jgi:hypothetical protein
VKTVTVVPDWAILNTTALAVPPDVGAAIFP